MVSLRTVFDVEDKKIVALVSERSGLDLGLTPLWLLPRPKP